ncbi:MAG: hypothetical protein ACRECV_19575 [Xanthobacteraceae bacterium]
MRKLLTLFGAILVVLGILFAAQGSGYLPWPTESFMVDNGQWIFYGGAVGAIGLIIIFASQFTI